MADPFDSQTKIVEVSGVQAPRRVVGLEVRHRLLVQEQADVDLILAALTDEQLFARGTGHTRLTTGLVVDQKRFDIQLGFDPIQRFEATLQAAKHRQPRGPAHRGTVHCTTP